MDPYIGEIRMFGGNFAPDGWALCQGQQMPISQYQELFSLIGTTYGGDGQSTFNLPDLRCRIPVHQGSGAGQSYALGQQGGSENVTLLPAQLPAHTHLAHANSKPADQVSPKGNVWAPASTGTIYAAPPASLAAASQAIGSAGGGQPHDNMSPFLVINFIIALAGIWPSQQ